MAHLRKTKGLPGSAPGGFTWATDKDVVEVDDELAIQLLEIPDAGFVTVAAPEPKSGGKTDDADEKDSETAAKKDAPGKTPTKTQIKE